MATKRKSGNRPELIHCDYCGEDYSDTYRSCPFCDEYDEYDEYEENDDYEEYERTPSASRTEKRSGGKRVAQSRRRGGGYTRTSPVQVAAIIISLAVILAAVWIVTAKLMPLINRGDVDEAYPNGNDSSQADAPSQITPELNVNPPEVTPEPPEITPDPPVVTPEPPEDDDDDKDEQPESGATGFTLNKTEFSFSAQYPSPITLKVTFTPEGTSAPITWSSSNSEIATVDENGKVSHGTKKGTATITAELSNGTKQTCKVHNQVTGGTSTSTTPEPEIKPSTTYRVNNSDFTFYREGETYRLKVVDYSGSVSWSSSDTDVASVSSDGVCKAVGNGTCTVTGKLSDGTGVKATVRVRID